MTGRKLTARTQFVAVIDGRTVVVLPGGRFSATDPIVKAHREQFDPASPTFRGASQGEKR
jgi:hypothetical protein